MDGDARSFDLALKFLELKQGRCMLRDNSYSRGNDALAYYEQEYRSERFRNRSRRFDVLDTEVSGVAAGFSRLMGGVERGCVQDALD